MTGDSNTDLAIAIGFCFSAFLLTWLATAKMKAIAMSRPKCRLAVAEFEVEADTRRGGRPPRRHRAAHARQPTGERP